LQINNNVQIKQTVLCHDPVIRYASRIQATMINDSSEGKITKARPSRLNKEKYNTEAENIHIAKKNKPTKEVNGNQAMLSRFI